MELIWKETDLTRLILTASEQISIGGELPSPDGRRAASVLISGAKVTITEAAAEQDAVRISGMISVNVIAQSEDGEAFSYVSGADFTHVLEAKGAAPGMTALADTRVQTLSVTPSDAGAKLEAGVDISVKVISSVPLRTVGGVSGLDDIEMKTVSCERARRVKVGSASLRLREELAGEGVADVIWSNGFATVRDISPDQGGSTVSGVMCVSAVTVDGAGNLGQIVRQIPFREHLNLPSEGDVICEAETQSVYVRALGEDFEILSMEAEVSFTVSRIEKGEILLPADAFSPSLGFDCLYEDVRIYNETGACTEQLSLKETIPLPENAAEPDSPAMIGARPIVTSLDEECGVPTVSGVLVTEVVYRSASGRLTVFTEDVPFSAAITGIKASELSTVRADCVASAVGMGERSFQIQYNLKLTVWEAEALDESAAVGLAERESVERPSGIAILFASEGEGIFDAAKKLGVSCESVRRLNPDIAEPFAEGERLIVLR